MKEGTPGSGRLPLQAAYRGYQDQRRHIFLVSPILKLRKHSKHSQSASSCRRAVSNGAVAMLEGRRDVWAAIDSSSASCVIPGTPSAVKELSKLCSDRQVQVFHVKSDIAFHSPLLNRLAKPTLKALAKIPGSKPHTRLYTTAIQDTHEPAHRNGA